MDAALPSPRRLGGAVLPLWAAWRSLRAVELVWFVLLGLGYGLVDLSVLADLPPEAPIGSLALRHLLLPIVVSLLLLPFWLPAARHPVGGRPRLWRLTAAALLGAAFAMALLWPIVRWLEWASVSEWQRMAKGHPMFLGWHWGHYASDVLQVFIPAGLGFALFDMLERREASERRRQQLQLEHHSLEREALAARLAALQAQVEPGFLFDALVDVERAYARGGADAPQRLDALIHHLRVALPRLREGSTTLASEAELLASWLAVASRREALPPTLARDWPPALAATPLPPMLLLPLLQVALRPAPARPANEFAPPTPATREARLQARTGDGGVVLTLALPGAGPCPPAEALRTLAARAQAAWAGPLELRCEGDADGLRFELCLVEPGGGR